MKIQCDQCKKKYNVKDILIKQNGTKFRCSACRYIFKVFPDHQKDLRFTQKSKNQIIAQHIKGDKNIFSGTGNINITYKTSPFELKDRQKILILLNKVNQIWIESVLKKSLYNNCMIQIGKIPESNVVNHPWKNILELPDQDSKIINKGTKVFEVYNDVGNSMLILGNPGSGKTISLLEIAKELIEHAKENSNSPVPIILNLSSWTNKHNSFFDWVTDEIKSKYHIPTKFSCKWLLDNRLTLLLDGLDEVKKQERNNCLKSLNNYLSENGVPGIVVCCRRKEYLELDNLLNFNAAITLLPLSSDQIFEYLDSAGNELIPFRTLIQSDAVLLNLAQTPLMLNIMIFAYNDNYSITDKHKQEVIKKSENRRKDIFNTYIDKMFKRKGKSITSISKPDWIKYNSWIADLLSNQSKSVFLIEELQPNSLNSFFNKLIYYLITRIVLGIFIFTSVFTPEKNEIFKNALFGMVFGICLCTFDLIINIVKSSKKYTNHFNRFVYLLQNNKLIKLLYLSSHGFCLGLILLLFSNDPDEYSELIAIGFIFGPLIFGLRSMKQIITDNDILLFERIKFSMIGALKGLSFSLLIISSTAVVSSVFFTDPSNEFSDWKATLLVIIPFWIILIAPISIIVSAIKKDIINSKIYANQGILLTIKNAIFSTCCLIIVSFIIIIPFSSFAPEHLDLNEFYYSIMKGYIRIGLLVFILFGSIDYFQHYILRFILYMNNYIPYNSIIKFFFLDK